MVPPIPDEREVRRRKVARWRERNVNPYPAKFSRSHTIAEAMRQPAGTSVALAGRLLTIRPMGLLTFAHLQDSSGTMQIQLVADQLAPGNAYQWFVDLVDRGDFVGVHGQLFTTKTGEFTVKVSRYEFLAKALRPLPEKWHGLKELELRYRKRYLDLAVNPALRELFTQRGRFLGAFRRFLDGQGFIEVETPVLERVPGGAEAEPFVTHHRTLDLDLYLRISLELHLKRLIVGGFERVYEIGRVFRNEGLSREHLQEFTLLEFYQAYADCSDLAALVQACYRNVLEESFGRLVFTYQGQQLDFTPPWPTVDYTTAVRDQTGLDVTAASLEELRTTVGQVGLNVDATAGRGRLIDQLYKKTVRPGLVQPTLVRNHPLAVSPLAKRQEKNLELTDRLTVVVAGLEVGNGFSELNDPLDQRERFRQQAQLRAAGDREAQMTDEDFLEALEHGMPPTAGFGVGLDRLFMVVTDQPSIRDVVVFPLMRPPQ